jgi:uncharacterized alkaline shock family protein YloU
MTSTQPTSTPAKDVTARSEPTLGSSAGKTTIADTVVSKIAGIAAKEVNGVYSLGGGASRMVGALRERIPGATVNHSQGVSVEVGEKQAAVDIDIVADYGVSIPDLANGLRRNVIAAIERMTGLEVTEVNVTVHDVHLEDDDDSSEQSAPARVQ